MKPNQELAEKYPWAVNQAKLIKSIGVLNDLKKVNPSFVVTEEGIKAEYVKRAGLLSESRPAARPLGKKIAPTYKDNIMDDRGAEVVEIEGMDKKKK